MSDPNQGNKFSNHITPITITPNTDLSRVIIQNNTIMQTTKPPGEAPRAQPIKY